MKRQLRRLQDLRDGGGFGFTVELFFLALRQISSLPSELKRVIYVGTFKAITSGWKNIKNPSGTQQVLLNLICDLVIPHRGVFSDFSYPEYIVNELLEFVGTIILGQGDSQTHINEAVRELQEGDCISRVFRDRVLEAITPSPNPVPNVP